MTKLLSVSILTLTLAAFWGCPGPHTDHPAANVHGWPQGGAITQITPPSIMGGGGGGPAAGPSTVIVSPIKTAIPATDGNPTDIIVYGTGAQNMQMVISQTNPPTTNQPFPNPIPIPKGSFAKRVLMPDSVSGRALTFSVAVMIVPAAGPMMPFTNVVSGPNDAGSNPGYQVSQYSSPGLNSGATVTIVDQSLVP
ncbi:MAG: hypothetical protein WCH46_04860 [bacterium]